MFEQLALKFGCKPDTVVTIFVTISVFTAGIIINSIINNLRIFKERRRYRKYFHTLVNNIVKYSSKQHFELEKSIKLFTINNQESYFVVQLTENSFQLFEKISFEKIYDSFFAGLTWKNTLRMKALNSILNQTALAKKVNENMRTDIDSLDKKFRNYEESWNESINSIRKIYDTLRQQNYSRTIKKELLPFYADLDKIVKEWSHQPDRAHRVMVKRFIVDKLNSNFFENHKTLEIAISIQNHNIDATMSFLNMENILEIYANLFRTYSRIHHNYSRIVKNAQLILIKTTFFR